jgi:uncharacterized protein
MKLGVYNTLQIDRKTKVGIFLTDGEHDVLLPLKYVPNAFEIGDVIEVFLYLDHQERPVATTLKPYLTVGDFAYLKVNYNNQFGSFLDWGLEKDLFVPFKEQARPMEVGKRYLIHAYLDEKSNRIVGSSRISKFLSNENLNVKVGEEVAIIISHITDMGINVIVNKKHSGLLYENELYKEVRTGEKYIGYIKKIRLDKKLDISLSKIGKESIDDNVKQLLIELNANGGFLRLTDDSHPEEIKTVLQMSKKSFKKAVGSLYKEKRIVIKEDGIYLI